MSSSGFKDHFSGHAAAYADARPRYPDELFSWLATLTASHDAAWDCGTGNGQAALGLAARYKHVIATDPSKEQIGNAFRHERISYRVTVAESSGIKPQSIDLVTVAQAVHWFDRPAFYKQANQVLKSGGAIAVWCYGLCSITPEVDAAVQSFYNDAIGAYWPPERVLIDEGYRTIEFPFEDIPTPAFSMSQHWNLQQFLAYLDTWSAVQRFIEQNGWDPVKDLGNKLNEIWGSSMDKRRVIWPLHLRAGCF